MTRWTPVALCTLLLSSSLAAQDRLTLFQPTTSTTAYLIDTAGTVVQSWPGSAVPGLSVYLLPDGDLLRTRGLVSGLPGAGGGIERLSYTGELEWQFEFHGMRYYAHHDVEPLPNGNVLMVVYEQLPGRYAVQQGRDPQTIGERFLPDYIAEIEPRGSDDGEVVWEWHAVDHMIQDWDPTKADYGVVADHPGRIDINYGPDVIDSSGDWLHVNGIDYNPELDQIAISVNFFDEIWIIDHSTTTAEAAGSTGGRSGRGGDLLYRYGNPAAYDRGTAADQRFFSIHDVQWIEPGLPGAGNLLAFNNGRGRPTGEHSSVEEWAPPVDTEGAYALVDGAPFGPAGPAWTYEQPAGFYSHIMGGCERLPNGNTLITESTQGRLFEVDASGAVVWSHTNAFSLSPMVFKARSYAACTAPVTSYCTAGVSANGCRATLTASGAPSASAPSGFTLTATGIEGDQDGCFYFGVSGRKATTFSGSSFQCVAPPVRRTGVVSGAGTPGSCDGLMTQDLAAYWSANPNTRPGLGTVVQAQLWYRDPTPTGPRNALSDAVEFTICP